MSRMIKDFNNNWKFSKLPSEGGFSGLPVQMNTFDDSHWECVKLPHTWNAVDGASGHTGICEGGEHYYRGLACYRKEFYITDAECENKSIYIEFGAANTVAEVFVNERFAGRHEGGYALFRFPISGYVKPGCKNVMAVMVSNAPTDYIAPITDQGDFTKMGGLYRDVRLIFTDMVHMDLEDYGSSGLYITPESHFSESATLRITAKLKNDWAQQKSISAVVKIFNTKGICACSDSADAIVPANEVSDIRFSLTLANPVFWQGRENPYLYSAEVTLFLDGREIDRVTEKFGIRNCRIDSEKGFFLNGKHLDLRGVNYHQDSYENGWAMTDSQRERDYRMMLDMGCTAVRMAHYQHAWYEYELCDRLGICVWTEIGIINKMSADESGSLKLAEGFSENAKQQLKELIRQNYNHPSVVVWGISNELYQMSDEIFSVYTELKALADEEDYTRFKTFADAQFWGKFMELPGDVVGYNRYFGWYKEAGPVEKFGEWLDLYHNEKESRPICVSEYGGGGAVSQHKDRIEWETEIDPWGERHYENYQSALHENIWKQFAKRDYLWGKFVWCMFDFASDGRQEGDTKGLNDKGLVTRERLEKDAYYFYKSVWSGEPMVYITEKRFKTRPMDVPEVKVYSNADCVELFVNGISFGKIPKSRLSPDVATVYTWRNCKLAPGKNKIRVLAEAGDCVLEDSCVWTGSRSPEELM